MKKGLQGRNKQVSVPGLDLGLDKLAVKDIKCRSVKSEYGLVW